MRSVASGSGIAGRLAAGLGLVGTADWSDMIGVLKEELRESHSGGNGGGHDSCLAAWSEGSAEQST